MKNHQPSYDFAANFLTAMTEINAKIIDKTEKAYKIRHEDRRGNVTVCWIPKSQIEYIRKYAKNLDGSQDCVIHIPDWLSEKNGL